MRIDGRLDEAVYSAGPGHHRVHPAGAAGGRAGLGDDRAWVLFDDDNLYVACRCWMADPEPDRRQRHAARQHEPPAERQLRRVPRHVPRPPQRLPVLRVAGRRHVRRRDRQRADQQRRLEHGLGRQGHADSTEGWIAEIAIPFKSLRYQPGREQIWGINLRRTIRGKNEYAYITPLRPEWGVGALLPRVGGRHAGRPRGAAGRQEPRDQAVRDLAADDRPAGVARRCATTSSPDAGVDVKYGVTKSLTADFTYNTDFAQVEVDEAQVNLTRFNLQFPEKREFFLEGQGIFTFGGVRRRRPSGGDAPTIFYSRRIGLRGRHAPCRSSPAAACQAAPAGDSIGALNIGTDEMPSPRRARRRTSPSLRVRRDILQRSTIGGAVHEPVGLDGGARQQPGRSASTPTSRFRRTSTSAATWRRRRPTAGPATTISYRAQLQLRGRSIRRAARSHRRRRQLQSGGRISAAASSFRQQLRVGALQPTAAAQRRRSASTSTRAASTTPPTTRTSSKSREAIGVGPDRPAEQRLRSHSSTSASTSCFGVHSSPRPASRSRRRLCVSARPRLLEPGTAAPALRNGRGRRRRVLRRHQEDGVA